MEAGSDEGHRIDLFVVVNIKSSLTSDEIYLFKCCIASTRKDDHATVERL